MGFAGTWGFAGVLCWWGLAGVMGVGELCDSRESRASGVSRESGGPRESGCRRVSRESGGAGERGCGRVSRVSRVSSESRCCRVSRESSGAGESGRARVKRVSRVSGESGQWRGARVSRDPGGAGEGSCRRVSRVSRISSAARRTRVERVSRVSWDTGFWGVACVSWVSGSSRDLGSARVSCVSRVSRFARGPRVALGSRVSRVSLHSCRSRAHWVSRVSCITRVLRVSRVWRVACIPGVTLVSCGAGVSPAMHGSWESCGAGESCGAEESCGTGDGRLVGPEVGDRGGSGGVESSWPRLVGWRAAPDGACGCLRGPLAPETASDGPGARFASSTRQRLADAFPGQSEIWGPERERETPVLPPESHARGRKSQSGVPVPERGSGALRGRAAFRVLRAARGPNSGLGGHTTEPRRHPSPTGVRREQVSLVEPSAQAGAGSSHGNSQYATATVAARTAAEPVSGRQRQLLAPRFAYRGWCSATPSARRPRSASAPIPRTAGSGAAANAKARSLVPVRVLMATSGPSRFTACCRPESPTTGHTAGDALRPGWTAVSRGDTRRRRETPTSGPETPRGRLPEKEPAPSSRSRPRDHQRHVDDNPATAVHTGGQGRIPRSIGFRYHHGGRRDRSQRTGNTR